MTRFTKARVCSPRLARAVVLVDTLVRLGKGRLRLGEPVIVLRPLFMACLGSVLWPIL